jgi:hypothetical protein
MDQLRRSILRRLVFLPAAHAAHAIRPASGLPLRGPSVYAIHLQGPNRPSLKEPVEADVRTPFGWRLGGALILTTEQSARCIAASSHDPGTATLALPRLPFLDPEPCPRSPNSASNLW